MSEVPVSYDAVMRVSRVAEPKTQKSLVKNIIQGESNREIRAKIKQVKAPRTSPEKAPHATHKIDTKAATVVVHFNKANPTKGDIVQALEEALVMLRRKQSSD